MSRSGNQPGYKVFSISTTIRNPKRNTEFLEVLKLFDDMDSDDKIKSYKIESKKKLDKDDIEDIAEKLEKTFDIDEKKVKKVVRYKVSFDAKGKDNDADLYIFSAKIKGRWSVIGVSTSKNYSMNGFNF